MRRNEEMRTDKKKREELKTRKDKLTSRSDNQNYLPWSN